MKKAILAANLAILGATPALAADLPAQIYRKAPAPVAAVSAWSGAYVGGNVGYGWGNGDTDFTNLPDQRQFEALNLTSDTATRGAIGGAQIGYNLQFGQVVAGLEADIQGTDINGSSSFPGRPTSGGAPIASTLSTQQSLSWFGTVRGRLGFTPSPDLLLYGTGGLAFGHVEYSANSTYDFGVIENYPASVSETKTGWAAGAGAEWAFTRNWSAKAEYLHIDLGNANAIGSQIPFSPIFKVGYAWKTQENIVRVGVNYHIN